MAFNENSHGVRPVTEWGLRLTNNRGKIEPFSVHLELWFSFTHLDHDESSFAKSRTLHGEGGRGSGISTGEVIVIISHLGSKVFDLEMIKCLSKVQVSWYRIVRREIRLLDTHHQWATAGQLRQLQLKSVVHSTHVLGEERGGRQLQNRVKTTSPVRHKSTCHFLSISIPLVKASVIQRPQLTSSCQTKCSPILITPLQQHSQSQHCHGNLIERDSCRHHPTVGSCGGFQTLL